MVDILMAVFNGGEYLKKQLDSVFAQTYGDFCLIVCDDGSSDGSQEVLKAYKARYPDKIKLFFNKTNMGAKNNFFKLLKLSTAGYIMFCDQDDIWDSGKIEKTLKFFKQNEYGGPLLVYTDMRVIDELDRVKAQSFNKFQAI
ncbi:MAG: glycosyltransferase, partial [Firmicutes bacterium]|nr:glycosyltransferase [Bacillota bacterium]